MKIIAALLAASLGQMNTLESKPIVHLRPNRSVIEEAFDGKRLELINSSSTILLPNTPPKPASQGELWSIEVKNLGPRTVDVVGKPNINIKLNVNETVHIFSDGATYTQKR